MSLDNSTTSGSDDYLGLVNGKALDIARTYPYAARNSMVELSLLFLSFGILTMLSIVSIYFALRRGSLSGTNVRVLFLTTVLLYVSTGTYMAALIWNASTWNHVVVRATDGFFSPSYDGRREITGFQEAVRRQSWMLTVTTVINLLIGDAIVWWRACAIWQNNVVNCVGPLLVTLTLLGQNAYTYISVMLSLTTNIAATSLIAHKAWRHRQLVKTYLNATGPKSRALKALGLLVESGVTYCALLVLIIVYGAEPTASPESHARVWFNQVVAYITQGCLAPLMAIYPTVIMVLVALKLSPIDNGGLSGVMQPDSVTQVDGGSASDTLTFHHSTVLSSGGERTFASLA